MKNPIIKILNNKLCIYTINTHSIFESPFLFAADNEVSNIHFKEININDICLSYKDRKVEKGRLFAIGTLEPGHSVGYHVHEEDMEICFFLEGEGIVQEQDGTEIKIGPGDTNIVDVGQGHMITNTGKTSLKYLAVIIYA